MVCEAVAGLGSMPRRVSVTVGVPITYLLD
jgi:hypothetical protein